MGKIFPLIFQLEIIDGFEVILRKQPVNSSSSDFFQKKKEQN